MDAIIEKLLNEDKMQKQQEIEDKITNVVNHPTKIYALGGIEEIGKNMYVFEQNDELFIVDCGIKFASEELLGIDAIVCPFDVLVEKLREAAIYTTKIDFEKVLDGLIDLNKIL